MAKKEPEKKLPKNNKSQREEDLPGYEPYPKDEDIYNKFKEEPLILPEDTPVKETVDKFGKKNEKDFKNVKTGDDLDIPGGELDDTQEDAGTEDEENNYYNFNFDIDLEKIKNYKNIYK